MKQCAHLLPFLFLLSLANGGFAQPEPDLPKGTNLRWDPSYELVFEDNFEGDSVDLGKWMDSTHWGTVIPKDPEKDNCPEGATETVIQDTRSRCIWNTTRTPMPDQPPVYQRDGQLTVSGTEGPIDCYCYANWDRKHLHKDGPCKRDYGAGWLNSRECFKYGYFEIRSKIPPPSPQTDGVGAAWWLFHDDVVCNTRETNEMCYAEIDMFEMDHLGGFKPHIHANTKLGETQAGQDSCAGPHVFSLPDQLHPVKWPQHTDSAWHTYAVEWTPRTIRFLIDGYVYAERCGDATYPVWQFDPMYIVFSINVNFMKTCVTEQTVFPYNWVVDYIRVWQIPGLDENPRLAKRKHARCKCRKWRKHPYYDQLNRKPNDCGCRGE